jgi:hypothetical protein
MDAINTVNNYLGNEYKTAIIQILFNSGFKLLLSVNDDFVLVWTQTIIVRER